MHLACSSLTGENPAWHHWCSKHFSEALSAIYLQTRLNAFLAAGAGSFTSAKVDIKLV